MGFRCVLFDFDFTLADSSDPITRCVRYALAAVGAPARTDREILRTVGLSLPEMFRILAPGHDQGVLATLFMEKAEDIMVEGTRVYSGVPEALDSLKAAGMMTGIVSTKLRRRIERILDKHGLLRAFDVIVGAEDVVHHKPAPDALLRAMSLLHVEPGEVVYAGDSLVDAEAARRAGVPFCAVLHGLTRREEFTPYSPVSIVNDVREVLPILTRRSA
ncbi:MAG: HAD-IA family hydrolase [Bacillota bacterium]|nr:HAD-IA family hydrolase [Bacillota bacterium]